MAPPTAAASLSRTPSSSTVHRTGGQRTCPACGSISEGAAEEHFHNASLYHCAACDLDFWHPVKMPDDSWHEIVYQGRDNKEMPLEPGHKFFLTDPRAPKNGRLLDIGCGVGNFLAAAQRHGFDVTGIEINRNAVEFARSHYGLKKTFVARPDEYWQEHQGETFDVVTFFEVLEHQVNPRAFLNAAKRFVAESGFIALSVPNRERWQTKFETLDYPPNHLTRWSPLALRNFLEANGFDVLAIRQEPLRVKRAAQVLGAKLHMGLVSVVAGGTPPSLADLADMQPEGLQIEMKRLETSRRHRWASRLVRAKQYAFWPAALCLLPCLRLRGYTGLYLYCFAQKKTTSKAPRRRAPVGEFHA